jgi:hypothetical protein
VQAKGVRPKQASKPLRPFDNKRRIRPRLIQGEFGQLLRIFDPIEVHMPQRNAKVLIGLDDREGRAGNVASEAEAAKKASSESGLARAEIAVERDHVAGAKPGRQCDTELLGGFS